jgi:hypothetical protein
MVLSSKTVVKIRSHYLENCPLFSCTLEEAEIEVSSTDTVTNVLEKVFRNFNRLDQADCLRLEKISYNLPSLSVNDSIILVDQGKYMVFLVESVGFTKVLSVNVKTNSNSQKALINSDSQF